MVLANQMGSDVAAFPDAMEGRKATDLGHDCHVFIGLLKH